MQRNTPRGELYKQNRLRKLFGDLTQKEIDQLTVTVQRKANPKKFMPKLPPVVRPHRTVYGYLRVSHLDSTISGLGLEAQEKQILSYFQHLKTMPGNENVKWGGFFKDETKSAYRFELIARKAGRELQAALEAGDVVIFAKLDRGFRNARDFMNTTFFWKQRGVSYHFMDLGLDSNSPMGELMLGVLALFAQWESARKSERTREALAIRRANGKVSSGKIPRGFVAIGERHKKNLGPDWDGRVIGRFVRMMVSLHVGGLRHNEKWRKVSAAVQAAIARREGRHERFCKRTEWVPRACWRWYKAITVTIPELERRLEEIRARKLAEKKAGVAAGDEE